MICFTFSTLVQFKMNITDVFVDNVYDFSRKVFFGGIICHAQKCLLDYLAASLAGTREYYDVLTQFLTSTMSSGQTSSIIGLDRKSSTVFAALLNGISAHAVELDDGQRFGNVHPGAPVISSLLAVGETYGLSLNDLYKGIIVGYESTLRLACSIQPGHKLKGFHATGPCGTIGATMGIAAMLGFSKDQIKSALSSACTSASGILEMIEGDTQMMPFNAGKAASNAVVSALAGLSGFKVPEDALGGKRGFLHCFADQVRFDLLTSFADSQYCTTNYFKPYAACGHCHAGIEASLKLREKEGFDVHDVERVDVQTYKLALNGHDHSLIQGVNSARMSIPFSVSVALTRGSAGIDDFGFDAISDEELLKLASKVHVFENVELTKQAPSKRMAIVTVFTPNHTYTESVDYPKGQPENPMTEDDIINKFYECGHFAGKLDSSLRQSVDMVFNERNYSISDLMHCIS